MSQASDQKPAQTGEQLTKMVEDDPDCSVAVTLTAAEQFFKSFERAARRWEMIIYPGMVALMLLLGYGFYLVFSLSQDMQRIAEKFDPQMGLHMSVLANHMEKLSGNIHEMSNNINVMTIHVRAMSGNLEAVNTKMDFMRNMKNISTRMTEMNEQMKYLKHMRAIDLQMASLDKKMGIMTVNIDRMRFDFSNMNRNVSRPLSVMNNMFPF